MSHSMGHPHDRLLLHRTFKDKVVLSNHGRYKNLLFFRNSVRLAGVLVNVFLLMLLRVFEL
jgi:hypothetical protein